MDLRLPRRLGGCSGTASNIDGSWGGWGARVTNSDGGLGKRRSRHVALESGMFALGTSRVWVIGTIA
jgi:hypothetical protein